ncbi:MAG: universal stress protein [Phenylobacterium sp.]
MNFVGALCRTKLETSKLLRLGQWGSRMWKRIVLASEGTYEGLIALLEGALLTRSEGASVHLVVISPTPMGSAVTGEIDVGGVEDAGRLVRLGLQRLARLGVPAMGEVGHGDPPPIIVRTARAFLANLVVVGHRRRSLIERWWSGQAGGYLVDHLDCSVLLARNLVGDDDFERELHASVLSETAEAAQG